MESPGYCLAVCLLALFIPADLSSQTGEPPAPRPSACETLLAQDSAAIATADVPLLMRCGDLFESQSDYPRAERAFEAAVRAAERIGDHTHIGEALQGLGDQYRQLGDNAHAEQAYERSLQVRRDAHNRRREADVLSALGNLRKQQGRYEDAQQYHRQSLELYEAVGDDLGVAIADNNIGSVAGMMGDYMTALQYLERSLEMLNRLGDRRRSATVIDNMGTYHRRLGDYDIGLTLARRAYEIRQDLNDRAGISKSLDSLAANYRAQGNYSAALASLQKSLALRTSLGLAHGRAEALDEIGTLYATEGAYAQAASYLERALDGAGTLGNPSLEAEVLAHLGVVQHLQGRHTASLKTLRRSLALTTSPEYAERADAARFALARVYLDLDRLQDAAAQLRQCRVFRERTRNRPGQADVLIATAEVERRRGRPEPALALATDARSLARDMDLPEPEWRALTEAGRAQVALGRAADAADSFDAAIAIVEDLRSRLSGREDAVSLFFADRQAPYQERIAIALKASRFDEAFDYAERSKARALLDLVRGDTSPVQRTMTDEERKRERDLRNALSASNAQLMRAAQSTRQDEEYLGRLTRRRNAARLAYDDFQSTLHASHPDLRLSRGQIEPAHVSDARQLLEDDSSAVVEFVVGPAGVWAFVVDRAELRTVHLPVRVDVLERDVDRFRQELANRDLRVHSTSRRLYDEVLGPLRASLAHATRLIVVPDQFLWGLPFQALESGPDHYVLDDRAISYAPSVAVLREEVAARRPMASGDGLLLAVGNPIIGPATSAHQRTVLMGDRLDPLPEAERQVEQIGALYGPSSRVLIGADAREDRWKAEAAHYRILQIATHGVIDDRSPLYSYLVLSRDDGGREDGLLEAWEIMNMHLDADLVVLSACETARGRVSAGEGVVGLMWAFFAAGAPAVLVSQWSVESASTTRLMVEFHAAWKDGQTGLSAAVALRRAALRLRRSRRYSHPFYWAGFILAGDAR